MKYLFLDIDGVLNHLNWYIRRDDPNRQDNALLGEEYYPLGEFDPECVGRVNEVVSSTGARIVLSSSWRLDGKERMAEIFGAVGLPTDFDMTPVFRNRIRGEEIAAFLSEHPCDRYVIVDDDSDMLPGQMANFVKCPYETGFDSQRAAEAVRILGTEL